jgi:hypothetical protein
LAEEEADVQDPDVADVPLSPGVVGGESSANAELAIIIADIWPLYSPQESPPSEEADILQRI